VLPVLLQSSEWVKVPEEVLRETAEAVLHLRCHSESQQTHRWALVLVGPSYHLWYFSSAEFVIAPAAVAVAVEMLPGQHACLSVARNNGML